MGGDKKIEETVSSTTKFLRLYYSDKKLLIEGIGFIGIIASLFLQITQYQTESLRMLQCLLLLIFGVLIGYCIIDFWIKYFKFSADDPLVDAIGSIIFSTGIIIFLGNLFSFMRSVFTKELGLIFLYNSIGIGVVIITVILYFTIKLKLAYPRKAKLILILSDIIFGVLGYILIALMFGKYLSTLIMMFYYTIINILFSLNIIKNTKVLYIIILISTLLFILSRYLKIL